MSEVPEVILKISVDSQGVVGEIDKIKAKYGEIGAAVRENKIILGTLLAEEKNLLAARAKTNNPTIVAQYNSKLKETRDHIAKVNAELLTQNTSLKEIDKQAKGTGASLNKAFDTTATKSLRAQLSGLKDELARATDPAEIARLATAAGHLKEEILSAAHATNIFESSKFAAIGNAFGDIGHKIISLDFAGAAKSSQLLVEATKQLTFVDAVKGIKDIGSTLLNVGKSLLTNPLFLIGGAIALIVFNFDNLKKSTGLIGDAFKFVGLVVDGVVHSFFELTDAIGLTNHAIQEFTANRLEKLNKSFEITQKLAQREIDIQKASGKETNEIEKKKLKSIIENSKIQLRLINDLIRKSGEATDDQKKRQDELINAAFDADTQLKIIEAAAEKKRQDKLKEASDKSKKIREDDDKFKLEQDNKLRDLEAGNISNQFDKLRAQLTIKYNRDFLDAKGNAALILEIQKGLKKDIDAVNEAEIKSNQAKLDKITKAVEAANQENLDDFFKTEQEKKSQTITQIAEEQRHQSVLLGIKLKGNKNSAAILLANDIANDEANLKFLQANRINNDQAELDEIDKLNNKIKEKKKQLADDLVKTDDDEKKAIKAALENLSKVTFDSINKVLSAQINSFDKQTSAQQKRVDDAAKIAEGGNSQLLELEKKRLSDLNKEKEKYVRAQQALAAVELIFNTAVAVSKAASQTGALAAIGIAAALIALVAGLASARSIASQAAFYKGGYTGDGNPNDVSTNLGVKNYQYHKKEFIHNHQTTSKYLKHFRDIHSGKMDLNEVVQQASLYKMLSANGIDFSRDVSPRSSNNYQSLDELKSLMRDTTSAIKNQDRLSVRIDENGLAIIATTYINKQKRLNNLAR